MDEVQASVSVESQSHLRCDNVGDEEEVSRGLGDVCMPCFQARKHCCVNHI